MQVAKFGGTSVGTPARVREVVRLSLATPATVRRVVVSSAFGGVTDRLIAAVDAAVVRDEAWRGVLAEVRERHRAAVAELVLPAEAASVDALHDALFGEVADLLHGVSLLRECTPRVRDAVISAGERASVPVLAAAFRAAGHPAVALDATAFVRTDDRFGEATVDTPETRRLVRDALDAAFASAGEAAVAVVTGFVAATADGVTTTLGRSGSDYTATILAGALDATECVIWTDVDGVLSADPRVVPEAFSLPRLSYEEAAELAHFGAKVLHPRTMRPLVAAGIPLRIANTMNPGGAGTRVGPAEPGEARIKALTAVRNVALVRVVGASVLEVADLAARVFAPLAGVPVYLVAQASAEGSLGLAVREQDAAGVVATLERALAREIERGDVLGVTAEGGAAVVAAVGAFVHDAPGLGGRMFSTLGRARVNARALAQGGGDHTLSAVVADADAPAAVRALHEAFACRRLRAHVVVVGTGRLGRRVLDLLESEGPRLREAGLNLRVVGVMDSRRLAWNDAGLASTTLDDAPGADLDALTAHLADARLDRIVVVAATASAAVAARHADWLGLGVAVVTPNKAAAARPAAAWASAHAAARDAEAPYLYDAAVGAGLGVVSRLRDLVRTGDTVRAVEGVLSGTVAFVMSRLREGAAFSEAVREARDLGYAEPDVRDDLSGRDVARKLALLARELGLAPDAEAAPVESLVPDGLADVPLDVFWQRLPEADAGWAARAASGDLQLVARLDADGSIRAAVEAVPPGSPLAGLRGPEVAVAFHTARTGATPLVVRGPGASADITAAVVLADIVRAAEAMR